MVESDVTALPEPASGVDSGPLKRASFAPRTGPWCRNGRCGSIKPATVCGAPINHATGTRPWRQESLAGSVRSSGADEFDESVMNIQPSSAKPIDVLKAINFVDSALFGIEIDIFKIRLLVSVCESPDLMEFGFSDPFGDFCLDFRRIGLLELNIRKGEFGPPYLEDGDLSAICLADFNYEPVQIEKNGATGMTDRYGEYREARDRYEVRFTLTGGSLKFWFVDLDVSLFDPLDFDRK